MNKKYHKEIMECTSGFPEIAIMNQVRIETRFQKTRGKCMKFAGQNLSSVSVFSGLRLDVIKYIDK